MGEVSGSTHMSKRLLLAIVTMLAALRVCGGLAYADEQGSVNIGGSKLSEEDYQVLWGPNPVDGPGGGGGGHPIDVPEGYEGTGEGEQLSGEYYGVICLAPTDYTAAILALGVSGDDPRWTTNKKLTLSSSTAGGDFYTFSKRFYNLLENGKTIAPDFYNSSYKNEMLKQSACSGAAALWGPKYVWACRYPKELYDSAREKLLAVLNDEDDGGGSGESGGSQEGEEDGTRIYFKWTEVLDESKLGGVVGVCFNVTKYQDAYNYNSENELGIFIGFGTGTGTFYTSTDIKPEALSNGYGMDICTYTYRNFIGGKSTVKYNGENYMVINDTVLNYLMRSPQSATKSWSTTATGTPTAYFWTLGDGGGDDEPTTPDGDWPEPETPTPKPINPTVPEPPDPTTPSDPVVPDPPTTPTPIGPNYPDAPTVTLPTIDDDNNFTVDLSGILDAMNEHCIHLQNCMIDCSEYMKDVLVDQTYSLSVFLYQFLGSEFYTTRAHNGNLAEYIVDNLLQGLHDGLVAVTDNQADLLDYFEDFAAWLDEKLDFQFPDAYDDTSVVYWLKRIYYMKTGTGINTRPDDPVADPFGIGQWLSDLANNLINALESLFPGLLGDLLGTIDLLKAKFPFSLPWDMMAILGVFAAEPEAPNVEFPCYTYTDGGLVQVGTYDIDMDVYSDVMEGVRFVSLLGFMAYTLSLMPKWAETMLEVVNGA